MRGRPADDLEETVNGEEALSGEEWLRRLPSLVGRALERWSLTPDGPARHGQCALVLPVRRAGDPAALKITWPHHEARTEHLALRQWAGRGVVRLLAADPASWSMLLERLDADRDLSTAPVDQACATVGDLLAALETRPFPAAPRLADHAGGLAAALREAPVALPRRFVEQARSMLRDLTSDTAADGPDRLLHTDLHFANVLAGQRAAWLAIDPKPMAGEAAYEVAPVLWNRWEESVASGDVRAHLRRRLSIVCEHAGIDEDRARSWTVVREVANAAYAARMADPGRVTTAIAVIKAMSG